MKCKIVLENNCGEEVKTMYIHNSLVTEYYQPDDFGLENWESVEDDY